MTKNVISSAKTLLTAYRKALVGLEEGLGEEFANCHIKFRLSTPKYVYDHTIPDLGT